MTERATRHPGDCIECGTRLWEADPDEHDSEPLCTDCLDTDRGRMRVTSLLALIDAGEI